VAQSSQNTIEISFVLENVAFIKSYSLESPSRIVMDVFDSELKSDIDEVYNYPVKKIRASTDKNITRIVIDLYEYVYWKRPIQSKIDNGVLLNLEIIKTKKLKSNMRDIVVAIDAGHGGKYPGSVGTNNILEKDVTLLIAKQLERTLKNTVGFTPLMIRGGDETVSLNDRYQIARRNAADIFISIHADGFRLSSVKGASVFIWSEEASSTVARNLSDSQRKRIQADIKNLKVYDFDEDTARQMYPEIYQAKIQESKLLGKMVLDQLKKDPATKIHKKNVEYADFRVLKSIDIPSILVESGFLTNPEDAERLKTMEGRRMIARSIFVGIFNYFVEKPIPNTTINNNSEYLTYEIQNGDTLSEIAIRFGVTVNSIVSVNNIKNNSIFKGQKIFIKMN
tara:strand:+ start:279 stop:1463 length:1185 start_codon:yes stop_codon:yes gene_type:complete